MFIILRKNQEKKKHHGKLDPNVNLHITMMSIIGSNLPWLDPVYKGILYIKGCQLAYFFPFAFFPCRFDFLFKKSEAHQVGAESSHTYLEKPPPMAPRARIFKLHLHQNVILKIYIRHTTIGFSWCFFLRKNQPGLFLEIFFWDFKQHPCRPVLFFAIGTSREWKSCFPGNGRLNWDNWVILVLGDCVRF